VIYTVNLAEEEPRSIMWLKLWAMHKTSLIDQSSLSKIRLQAIFIDDVDQGSSEP